MDHYSFIDINKSKLFSAMCHAFHKVPGDGGLGHIFPPLVVTRHTPGVLHNKR